MAWFFATLRGPAAACNGRTEKVAEPANSRMTASVSSMEAWSTMSSSQANGTGSRAASALRKRGSREARLRVQTTTDIFTRSSTRRDSFGGGSSSTASAPDVIDGGHQRLHAPVPGVLIGQAKGCATACLGRRFQVFED